MLSIFSIFEAPYGEQLLSGFVVTLELTLAVFVLGCVLGVALAVAREIQSRVLRFVITAFVEYHRNVPMVVQLFVWYFGIPQLFPAFMQDWLNEHNGEFIFAWIGLGVAFGAYLSEDIRSGIRAVSKQQQEAAFALGFNYLGSMRWVVLPQAILASAPALINQSLIFFKATSLAMTIGLAELTYAMKTVDDATYRTFDVFAVVTLIYVSISGCIMWLGAFLERRAQKAIL